MTFPRVEQLDLTIHRDGFCKILLDLHKHYHTDSELGIEKVSYYLDDVLQDYLTKYLVYVYVNDANDIVGFAACYESISFVELHKDRTCQLQLKELFVRDDSRDKGIGQLLMQQVLKKAKESGCYRVDWNVREWNEKGIQFYKKLGAEFVEDRRSMRIDLNNIKLQQEFAPR